MRREEKVLKKLTVVYIQKDLTLGYTIPTLNLFNSYSFFSVKFIQFFFKILSILTHTEKIRKSINETHPFLVSE